jgi:misacylated tRNA(Ala) deacylase
MQILYLDDCYLKKFKATVESVTDDKYVVLDKTAFYPNSGGQPYDTGVLKTDIEEFPVIFVAKFGDVISHEVSKQGLSEGDEVWGEINWDRRYLLMRYHTAAHLLSEVIHKETGARITGNQLTEEKGRIDFDLEAYDREALMEYIKKANEIIRQELPVKTYFLDSEEALNNPDFFSLKNKLPPEVKKLRIVEIQGFDTKACGGTHVKNVKEIGKIEFLKAENKDKNNRRLYFGIV